MSEAAIRVLIVDDHRVVREGLELLLARAEDIEVVGSTGRGSDAVELCARHAPHVVLMDLSMPDLDGIAATRLVRAHHPDIEVLVLTSFLDEQLLRDALDAGACGYLLKSVGRHDLVAAIRAGARGQPTVDPQALPLLFRPADAHRLGDDLTARERDVLALLVDGLANEQIADALRIRTGTVRVHVSNILAKLGVDNRTAAAVTAVRHQLVTPAEG